MGPAYIEGAFVFVGAFSTERLAVKGGVKHGFVSFNQARDDFCLKMDSRSAFRKSGRLDLGNAMNDSDTTTGDHDGLAWVLTAAE